MNKSNIPLIIDLDGTLTKSDTLLISINKSLSHNFLNVFKILFYLLRGKKIMKKFLSINYLVDPREIKYNKTIIDLINIEKKNKREIILCSASNINQLKLISNYLQCFDKVYGSDEFVNLKGRKKLNLLLKLYGKEGFDYIGNDFSDICIWKNSNLAYCINISYKLRKKLKKNSKKIIYLN